VLRQGGLRDDLRALATRVSLPEPLDPFVCLFAELDQRWNPSPSRTIGAEARSALLLSLMKQHGAAVFGRSGNPDGWIGTVDRVVADLSSEGITPAEFSAATAAAANATVQTSGAQASGGDSRRNAPFDAFEAERDAALVALYRDYVETLAANGWTDGRDSRVRLAAEIARDPDAFAERIGGRRDVRIVGLADLRGGWHQLLAALAESPAIDAVSVYTSHPLDLPAALHASTVYDQEGENAGGETADAPRASSGARAAVALLEAPDSAREAEIIAVRVRGLIEAGVAPERIAVVSRESRPAVDVAVAALGRVGVPVSARRRIALASTGPARAIRQLLAGATNIWPLQALVEISENPYLGTEFDTGVLHGLSRMAPLSSRDEWRAAFTSLIARCERRDREPASDMGRSALPETARVVATFGAVRGFLDAARELDEHRPVSDWFAWTIDALTGDGWGIAASLDARGDEADAMVADAIFAGALRTDRQARVRIVEIASAWREAIERFGSGSDVVSAELFSRKLALALDEDLIVTPETGAGVRVSEALAAAWRGFDHLFITGLSDGSFPLRPPRCPLLGDRARRRLIALGLPLDPPDAWRKREQELFRVLCAAPLTSLTLSWAATDAEGNETVPSSYIERMLERTKRPADGDGFVVVAPPQHTLTEGFPVAAEATRAERLAHARRVAATERARRRTLSPYNGEITDAALIASIERSYGGNYTWSATGIEELAKCPWHWMAKRLLGLEERAEADDALEPSTAGTILHEALERFFAAARERVGGPVFLRATDAGWATPLLEASLRDAWTHEDHRSWLGVPVLRELARAELLHALRKYLRFEIDYNERSYNNRSPVSKSIRTGATYGELQFDGIVITVNGTSFRLRGTIDRVDTGVDERVANPSSYLVAIDYKSSKSSTPAHGSKRGWDDGVVLQVPLYAQAVRQLFPESTLARLEYRTLRTPEVVHPLQFVKLDKPDKSGACAPIENADATAQFAEALTRAARHIEDARQGRFPTRPAPSCGCSPYCPARDACRVPGGPVEGLR
jgi:RecB family exonuclease